MNPRASNVRILRPFDGFEKLYQGKLITFPIAFPGTLDFEAGEPNYDPDLLSGIAVPFGSRVVLWIPLCFTSDPENPDPQHTYSYQLLWRLRASNEFVDAQQIKGISPSDAPQYHIGSRELGNPELFGDPASRQYILPCAMETIGYEQTEPGTPFANGTLNLRGQIVVPTGAPFQTMPFSPNGNSAHGSFEQGCFANANGGGETGGPGYMTYVTDAVGDELIITVTRTGGGANWDFTSNTLDRGFSNTFGTDASTRPINPNLGIFVITSNM